jgi:hypothetical protein
MLLCLASAFEKATGMAVDGYDIIDVMADVLRTNVYRNAYARTKSQLLACNCRLSMQPLVSLSGWHQMLS